MATYLFNIFIARTNVEKHFLISNNKYSMTVPYQPFRIMPRVTTNAFKKNDKLFKAVRYLIKPNVLKVNLQNIKVFKEIITFRSCAITNLKTPCIYLA